MQHTTNAQRWEIETQRYRVLTDVRVRFFEALAAQRQVDTINEFADVARRGVQVAKDRKDAKEGKVGELAFLQILVVRRSYYEATVQLIAAQGQLAQASAKVDGLLLTVGLDAPVDYTAGDGVRGQTFSGQ